MPGAAIGNKSPSPYVGQPVPGYSGVNSLILNAGNKKPPEIRRVVAVPFRCILPGYRKMPHPLSRSTLPGRAGWLGRRPKSRCWIDVPPAITCCQESGRNIRKSLLSTRKDRNLERGVANGALPRLLSKALGAGRKRSLMVHPIRSNSRDFQVSTAKHRYAV